jgi:hypothetical protein
LASISNFTRLSRNSFFRSSPWKRCRRNGDCVAARLERGDRDDHALALGNGRAGLLDAGGGGLAAGEEDNDRETGRDEFTRHRGEAPVFVG